MNFDPDPSVKTRPRLVCRPCDRTSGDLNKTSVREKFRGVYLPMDWNRKLSYVSTAESNIKSI